MYHSVLRDAKFFAFLSEVDADLANETRSRGCPDCGGVLDGAKFPRKPRALVELGPEDWRRFSFCCRAEGCRRRRTPPSVRFLGRKVYVAAVVLLATAMQHGPTARRVTQLSSLLGISRRTLTRWRTWWREIFAALPAWRVRVAHVAPATVNADELPLSLLERFEEGERERVLRALRFVAPVIVEGAF